MGEFETDMEGDTEMTDQETTSEDYWRKQYEETLEKWKKEKEEREKIATNCENVKRHFEEVTRSLHRENDEMKEQRRAGRGRGRISEGYRNRNEREEGERGRGPRGRGQGGRTETGAVKKDKMRKESTEKEMEHEKVIRNDMICQKWIDQGRRCLRY